MNHSFSGISFLYPQFLQ